MRVGNFRHCNKRGKREIQKAILRKASSKTKAARKPLCQENRDYFLPFFASFAGFEGTSSSFSTAG